MSFFSSNNNNMLIKTSAGPSKLLVMDSTGMVINRAGIPKPMSMLNILLPRTVPTANRLNPLRAEVKTVKNSGAVVPKASNIPAKAAGIFRISANSTVE